MLSKHFVFFSKYGEPIFRGQIKIRVEELIRQKALEIKCEIVTLEMSEDYVTLFIKIPIELPIPKAVQFLKGFSAYMLKREFTSFKDHPSIWAGGYGMFDYTPRVVLQIENFVKNQRDFYKAYNSKTRNI